MQPSILVKCLARKLEESVVRINEKQSQMSMDVKQHNHSETNKLFEQKIGIQYTNDTEVGAKLICLVGLHVPAL